MATVPDTPETVSMCICEGCPSFPGAGTLFCARGKSDQAIVRRGCICPDCQNFRRYSLSDGYYCVDGAAGEGPR